MTDSPHVQSREPLIRVTDERNVLAPSAGWRASVVIERSKTMILELGKASVETKAYQLPIRFTDPQVVPPLKVNPAGFIQ
jgi:hypothetical protein